MIREVSHVWTTHINVQKNVHEIALVKDRVKTVGNRVIRFSQSIHNVPVNMLIRS